MRLPSGRKPTDCSVTDSVTWKGSLVHQPLIGPSPQWDSVIDNAGNYNNSNSQHLFSPYYVPGTDCPSLLHIYKQHCRVDAILIPILQDRKLRFQKAKEPLFPKGTRWREINLGSNPKQYGCSK